MDLTDPVNNTVQSLDAVSNVAPTNEADRISLKSALFAAISRLETPWETAYRYFFSGPALMAALKVCYDLRVFQKWEESGGGTKDANELAELAGADPALLKRLLRHLGSMHTLTEVSKDTYALEPFSQALAKPGIENTVPLLFDENLPGYANLPDYLRSVDYKNPTDPAKPNWHHLKGFSHFEEIRDDPFQMGNFQNVMTAYAASKPSWTDIYPVQHLVSSLKPGVPLVVDVGGGKGHDLEKLRSTYPNLPPGSLVLQDQASVVEAASLHGSITTMAHDFFTPQPVKGARTYYLHTVLHDWPDVKATEILRRLAAALERDYSSILIHETVLPESQAPAPSTTSDLQMMMALTAYERTDTMWRELLSAAGLKMSRVFKTPVSSESVTEVELM